MGARARPAGALPPDEPRGRVRRLPPPGARHGGRAHRQPRRLDALLVGDPRRARAVHRCRSSRCTCPTSTTREEWRRHSVLDRARRHAGRREGLRRLPRGARAAGGETEPDMSRLDRLAAALDGAVARHRRRQRPLPDRLRELELRAARRAGRRDDAVHRLPLSRGRAGGRRGRVRRRPAATSSSALAELLAGTARRLRGRSNLASRSGRRSRAGGRRARRRPAGVVEALRAVKDPSELGRDPASVRRSRTRSTRRSARSGSPAAPRPSVAWWIERVVP